MRIAKIGRVIVIGLSLGIASAHAETPLVIRHGWVSITNILSPVVFEKKDILRHYGQSYTVAPQHFAGTTPELQALAAGEIDIATFGTSTVIAAVENAHMDDIRVVADGLQDGAEGYFSASYLALNDSGIGTVEDLKGKVLSDNAIGGSVDMALRVMLRRHHMEDRKDVSIIEAQFPSEVAMLLQKKVDLVTLVAPYVYDPRIKQAAHVLFTMKDVLGPTQSIILVARAGWLEKNRPAVQDFFEDMLRGIRWFTDPANRPAAIAIVAAEAKQPPERLDAYLYTKADYYHAPDGHPDIAAMQRDIAMEHDLGFTKAVFDIKPYVDLSFVDEAARRLK